MFSIHFGNKTDHVTVKISSISVKWEQFCKGIFVYIAYENYTIIFEENKLKRVQSSHR